MDLKNDLLVQGELVPEVIVNLTDSSDGIFFEHHILLWKEASVNIKAKVIPGIGKRVLAGMPVIISEAHGQGKIAFSRDGAGQIVSLQLNPGNQIDVREHQFLLATKNVQY